MDLKAGRLFPSHFLIFAIFLLIMGMVSIVFAPLAAPIFIIIGVFIITGYEGTEFDASGKRYKEYKSFIFMKFGEWKNYDSIQSIFINSSKTSQKVYTRVTEGSTISYEEYDGYMEFTNGNKIHLLSNKDKQILIDKLHSLVKYLDTKMVDNTLE